MKAPKKFLSQRSAKIAAIVELRTAKTKIKKIYDNVPRGPIDQVIWVTCLLAAIRTLDEQMKNIKKYVSQ